MSQVVCHALKKKKIYQFKILFIHQPQDSKLQRAGICMCFSKTQSCAWEKISDPKHVSNDPVPATEGGFSHVNGKQT